MAELAISTGGREYVPPAAALLSKAFEDDPVINYLLSGMAKTARLAYMEEYFTALLIAAAMNKGEFTEIDEWKSCGVLMLPGNIKVNNPFTIIQAGIFGVLWNIGLSGIRKMLVEFVPMTDKVKEKELEGQKLHYYVFFVGTKADARGKGLCSKILRKWQERAKKEGIPIWLEATTRYSMEIYKKEGFELVEEMTLGKGKAGVDGEPKVNGEGVTIWGMIWRPGPEKLVDKL